MVDQIQHHLLKMTEDRHQLPNRIIIAATKKDQVNIRGMVDNAAQKEEKKRILDGEIVPMS